MHTNEEFKKSLEVYKELRVKYSDEEILSKVHSFDKIKHILGPLGFFMPIMDEDFNALNYIERDDKDPNKIGPKTKKRLKFLLEEYENALPFIELGLKQGINGKL